MNKQHMGGLKPEGSENWKKELHMDGPSKLAKYPWITPKFSNIAKGSRLTPKRIHKLKISNGITAEERKLLMEVLFNRGAQIAFDFMEKGNFKPEVEPLHVIPTILHKP